MEIENENEKDISQISNPTPKVSSLLQTLSDTQINYLSKILGIKINKDEMAFFSSVEDLASFINTIKFPEKKKNEAKDSLIDVLKSLNSKESMQKITEEKSKKFSEVVKINGTTTMFATAEKDELSPTMHAFYFCDKSTQIFSDKDTAAFKNMNLETQYPNPFLKDNEDNSSYNSNFIEAPVHPPIKNLGKKTNRNHQINTSKSGKKKKIDRNSEEIINNTKNVDDFHEAEYCIPNCKYARKSRNQPMIECDNCRNWYHTKCLEFTDESFKKYAGNGKEWYCPKCKEEDNESNKNSEEGN